MDVRENLQQDQDIKNSKERNFLASQQKLVSSEQKHERLLGEINIVRWTIYVSLVITATVVTLLVVFEFACSFSTRCSFQARNFDWLLAIFPPLITLALGYLFGRGSR